jgi:hypothetical protein
LGGALFSVRAASSFAAMLSESSSARANDAGEADVGRTAASMSAAAAASSLPSPAATNRQYAPLALRSSACVPCSRTRPWAMMTMVSASRACDTLCVVNTTVVLPWLACTIAASMRSLARIRCWWPQVKDALSYMRAVARLRDGGFHSLGADGVKRRRGLVQQQQRGLAQQGPRESHALLFAAR